MSHQQGPHSFQTTRWSIVRKAVDGGDVEAMSALTMLCGNYWYPIYAYIRRTGRGPHDAEDLTQGFFAQLLRRETLAVADREKGNLRSFLLTCVRHHLANEHARAMAIKRGAKVLTSLDGDWAEDRYAKEPVDHLTPDRLYQRRWALTIVDQTMTLLEQQMSAEGKQEQFQELRPFLGFSQSREEAYETVAARMNVKVNTLKSHIHRLRENWRELLLQQVACTLDDPTSDNIKAELAELIGCV